MTTLQSRPTAPELINVHQVIGDKDAIRFLKNTDHEFVEGLFYSAKRYGHTTFLFNGQQYDVIRNRDMSFTVSPSVEQTLTTESLS